MFDLPQEVFDKIVQVHQKLSDLAQEEAVKISVSASSFRNEEEDEYWHIPCDGEFLPDGSFKAHNYELITADDDYSVPFEDTDEKAYIAYLKALKHSGVKIKNYLGHIVDFDRLINETIRGVVAEFQADKEKTLRAIEDYKEEVLSLSEFEREWNEQLIS